MTAAESCISDVLASRVDAAASAAAAPVRRSLFEVSVSYVHKSTCINGISLCIAAVVRVIRFTLEHAKPLKI